MDDQFARWWLDHHALSFKQQWGDRQEAFIKQFEVDEEMWQEFLSFAQDKGLRLVEAIPTDPEDEQLQEVFAQLGLPDEVWPDFKEWVASHRKDKDSDNLATPLEEEVQKKENAPIFTWDELNAEAPLIRTRIKAHIARKNWGISSWFPIFV